MTIDEAMLMQYWQSPASLKDAERKDPQEAKVEN